MQNWSKQTKQYLLIALGILLLCLGSVITLQLQHHGGYALPEVLYVLDEEGSLHEPKSALSKKAIRNLRAAGIDTLKKEYPSVVLLNKNNSEDSELPRLILSRKTDDIQQLIAQNNSDQ